MKKNFKIGLIFCGAFLLFAVGLVMSACKQSETNNLNQYTLNLSYDSKNMTLSGQEEVCYFNSSENAFDQLYFHLYPNAFREGAISKVVSSTKSDEAYYNGVSYGNIQIQAVAFDSGKGDYSIGGEDENILIIPLQETLYPDESVKLYISFEVNMPQINHRLGVGENTVNFGNFYPIACVYEEGVGFSQDLYHSNGDPFYSDCANYMVSIEYDSCFQLASSGTEKQSEQIGDKTTKTISAQNVRDFCFVLSEKFEQASQEVEGVAVNYYGYQGDEDLQKNLDIASSALQTFNQLFGQYPYQTLSIVKANFLHGGMEFPNIVLISDNLEEIDYGYVIVHEIAHQWWYGVVGNDQYNHAWMDEGLAEYSTLLFYKNNPQYGEDFDKMIANAQNSYKLFVKVYSKVNGKVDLVMDKPVCEFETEPEYVECTYTKGVLLMDAIKGSVGEKTFLKALKNYYSQYQFKNATPAHFISVFNKTCGGDMESFINSWLYDKIVTGY